MSVDDLKSQILSRPGIRELALFRRQYFQRWNIAELSFPTAELLRLYSVQQWIWGFVEYAQENQPYQFYEKLFLKALLEKIEEAVTDAEEPDIVDAFANLYSALLLGTSIPTSEGNGYVWLQYVPPWEPLDPSRPDNGIELLEKPNVLSDAGCTGHRTWEAALSFARWLQDVSVRGKRVLELGAGTGLLSLMSAKQGAAQVVATDADEGVLSRLAQAAKRNDLPVVCKKYLWGDDLASLGTDFDVILGADVTYDPTNIPSLHKTLTELTSRNEKAVIWICAVSRNEETLHNFQSLCERGAFDLSVMHDRSGDTQTGLFHKATAPIEIMLITGQSKGRQRKTIVDAEEWRLEELRVLHTHG